MKTARRVGKLTGPAAAAAILASASLAAQEGQTRPDSTLGQATDTTLQVTRRGEVVPTSIFEVPRGPLPPGSRLTFSRDSIFWTSGYTLADLLSEVPGVYLARGGFVGQPTPALYAGRGPTSLEIFWDGIPMVPVGPDSLALDPGTISLFPLRRVEVEVLPAGLRVYLISERHESPETRSVVRVVSGDFKTGMYAGLFQHRWRNGLGISAAGDFVGTQGDRDPRRDASWLDIWLKTEWNPSPTAGASFQIRRGSFERDPTGTDPALVPGRESARTDAAIRFTASTRPNLWGFWSEAGLATTAWSRDSASPDTLSGEHTYRRAYARAGYRAHRTAFELGTRLSDHYTTAAAEGRLGLVPLSWVLLAADGSWERHRGDRRSVRGHAALSLYRGAFSLVGELAKQNAVAAPMIASDTAQKTTDYGVRAGLNTRRLTGHVGLVERGSFAPVPFTSFPGVAGLRTTQAARYLVADLAIRFGAWTINGWYSNPVRGEAADFQPPKHGRTQITFRSKFWRTFRSGAFDLKVQLAMESWSTGTAGLGDEGQVVPLPGATFYDAFLQIGLESFRIFYSLKNIYRSREQFVPGIEYPRTLQTFGVKWTFTN